MGRTGHDHDMIYTAVKSQLNQSNELGQLARSDAPPPGMRMVVGSISGQASFFRGDCS